MTYDSKQKIAVFTSEDTRAGVNKTTGFAAIELEHLMLYQCKETFKDIRTVADVVLYIDIPRGRSKFLKNKKGASDPDHTLSFNKKTHPDSFFP